MLKSPSPATAKLALDKASKRFDKDKYKKRGTLALRTVSLEFQQCVLQEAAVDYATTMQTVREAREVEAVKQLTD